MTKNEVDLLITSGFSDQGKTIEMIETHISWVIITPFFAFKLKKPVKYPFLDFSTLDKRKFYCEREVLLNSRLSNDVYLGVLPVWQYKDKFVIGEAGPGTIVDYTVQMRTLDPDKRMDKLLNAGLLTFNDLKPIAEKLITFHQHATEIKGVEYNAIGKRFAEVASETEFLAGTLGSTADIIQEAIQQSDNFVDQNSELLKERVEKGYIRDVHGDLHARNIFLLDKPIIFDCIEFSDELRQIDLLNELAFFCMDLDVAGYQELSSRFFEYYNQLFCICKSAEEEKLFVYFKAYRANVRAKVNSLRARSADSEEALQQALNEARRYLILMKTYMDILVEQHADHNR
ncbi:hypothetical protein C900_00047 [Fulvivirga imtechensis AK7]|uniref:Aminoglycoside phosphotransferase domain-containing protein n=1 Tax=Fulvivirga imtechensis AK7 TaxID=1237149 RepID=L8K0F7_9BACT|nr:hypothetical protein [Fulvivirga imtechensis]ELR73883.1 hypothetical protein C900_00047 [Fulvivirga imtechensis AK7]